MGPIFEKITLYDVLGYFVPGSLVMLTVCGMFLPSADQDGAALYQDYESLFIYGFILTSYICGILLSEISRIIMDRSRENEKPPIPDESIKLALRNAGVIAAQDEDIKITDYFKQMYGDIQSDPEYRRIHNYASAEVLYKNLAPAVLISAVILCISFPEGLWGKGIVLISGAAGMRIAWHRGKRFRCKKQDYTVCWYVEKYLGKKVKS